MPRHEAVRPMTDGQRKDITTTLLQAIPPLSYEDAKYIGGTKGSFIEDIQSVFAKYSRGWTLNKQLMAWHRFYKVEFNRSLDFVGLQIPPRREGFDRLIVVAEGVTIDQVHRRCRERFFGLAYTNRDLDYTVDFNDRNSKSGSYAVWVRDNRESDEEWVDHSSGSLRDLEMKGETLLERLLHEFVYYIETGDHLDVMNVTLCSGSRDRDGYVPGVCFHNVGIRISRHGDTEGSPTMGPREVVSL